MNNKLLYTEISDHNTPYGIFNIQKEGSGSNDHIAILNKLITNCIADHAPIKKVKFIRQPAPWIKDPELVTTKEHLEHVQSLKNANGTDSNKLSDYRKSKVRY